MDMFFNVLEGVSFSFMLLDCSFRDTHIEAFVKSLSALSLSLQILFHSFEITISKKNWWSQEFLCKAIMVICCTSHGMYMMRVDMLLQPLRHIGINACTCKWNLFHLSLHGNQCRLQVHFNKIFFSSMMAQLTQRLKYIIVLMI